MANLRKAEQPVGSAYSRLEISARGQKRFLTPLFLPQTSCLKTMAYEFTFMPFEVLSGR